ncbi:MAG TPA: hypothetical protein VJ783_00520 [Pirellulales bacterium]|nr:hypothetical protein [Pirellulales bacterium]
MGAYHIVVNPTKRQFLDPGRFDEGKKLGSVLHGVFCVDALKLLIADSFLAQGTRVSKPRNPWSLEGSWVGDPIVLASDDCGPPDPAGIITTSEGNSLRNLYVMAVEEFENISYLAIVMLSENRFTSELIEKATRDDSFFLHLANVVMQFQPQNLKVEFEREFGKAWPKALQRDLPKGNPWRAPAATVCRDGSSTCAVMAGGLPNAAPRVRHRGIAGRQCFFR